MRSQLKTFTQNENGYEKNLFVIVQNELTLFPYGGASKPINQSDPFCLLIGVIKKLFWMRLEQLPLLLLNK